MKKIMIDMDDVICGGGFLYQLNKFLGTNYTENDTKGYYMQELIPDEKFAEWNNYITKQNLYEDGNDFLPYAREVIEKLCRCYDVYILTAYIFREVKSKSGLHLFNKFEWLCKEMPFIDPYKFIFCCCKDVIDCDIRIDDKPSNLQGNAEKKILVTAYHNKDISDEELNKEGIIRVSNWLEIEKLLLSENLEKVS